jgi:hypothetical protein
LAFAFASFVAVFFGVERVAFRPALFLADLTFDFLAMLHSPVDG